MPNYRRLYERVYERVYERGYERVYERVYKRVYERVYELLRISLTQRQAFLSIFACYYCNSSSLNDPMKL